MVRLLQRFAGAAWLLRAAAAGEAGSPCAEGGDACAVADEVSLLQLGTVMEASRTCLDGEVERYHYYSSMDPKLFEDKEEWARLASPPSCVPADSDEPAPKPPAAVQTEKAKTTGEKHLTVIGFATVDDKWCKHPCLALTFEKNRPKPADGDDTYSILDAAVWEEEKRIAVYEFDAEWEKQAKTAYTLCSDRSWSCQAVADFRESKKIYEKSWANEGLPSGAWSDELSAWLADAVEEILGLVRARPSKYYSFAYTGHGGQADGGMFTGRIQSKHAVAMWQKVTAAHGKWDIFDYSTNCQEGKWGMVNAQGPFVDYILASDLNVEGIKMGARWQDFIKNWRKYEIVQNLPNILQSRPTPREICMRLLDDFQKIYDEFSETMGAAKQRQTKALYDISKFATFQRALAQAFEAASASTQEAAVQATNGNSCDTQTFLQAVDDSAGSVWKAWTAFRPKFISSQKAFKWPDDKNVNGLRFLWYTRDAVCDVGAAGIMPACLNGGQFKAWSGSDCADVEGSKGRYCKDGYHGVDKNNRNVAYQVCESCGFCAKGAAKVTLMPEPAPTPAPAPTQKPQTALPTASPTASPTDAPTESPTPSPTAAPTSRPTRAPTSRPAARQVGRCGSFCTADRCHWTYSCGGCAFCGGSVTFAPTPSPTGDCRYYCKEDYCQYAGLCGECTICGGTREIPASPYR
eukprot:TRINITY_DN6864_c0_g1_i3.p1 TRINITY_DN6864_c0_g1~~TRINITY_DN6864_c0_g1_i3.p1  ORF type:complete len:716 (-),score=145.18 TRINITY_DN6864_c0_g1_i3:162-2228(-)